MSYDSISLVDVIILVLYFVIVMVVGTVATYRAQRGSTKGLFLAGRSMTFIPIAGSIFATNMGSSTFIGLAGSAAANGFAPIMFEWHATYILILLGWVFVPIYIASSTFTMPGYMKKRYGGKRLQVYYAVVQLVLIVAMGISAQLYSGSLFINRILGWDLYLSTILILSVTGVYTIAGGLTAVMYTDTLQAGILIGGTLIVSGLSMYKVGGYEALLSQYKDSASNTTMYMHATYGNLSCGFPPKMAYHIFQDANSSLFPWPGLVFGLTILATFFFCSNQLMVQRNLAAKNVSHSKAACVLASYLKLLPFFLFVLPGMISRVLFPEEVACTDPDDCISICGNRNGCTNVAYPILVLRILPTGLRGLMLAALLAALMSTLTSDYNSASSIFTMDIWTFFRPAAKEKEMVLVGRLFTLCLIGISVAWLPVLQLIQGSQLWNYLQSVSAYITPPWVVVFVLGMMWKRTTEQGAFWGLMAGLVTGISRMVIHFSYPSPTCGGGEPDTRPAIYTRVHYLHFALILAAVTLVVTIVVSFLTMPRRPEQLRKVTWWTRNENEEPELTDNEDEEQNERRQKEERDAYVPPSELSAIRNCYNVSCGFNKQPGQHMTWEMLAEIKRKSTNIEENPFWKRICDINAVIVIAVTCFIIGFYA